MEWEELVRAISSELRNPNLRADDLAQVIEQAFPQMGRGLLTRKPKAAAVKWAQQVIAHTTALETMLAEPPFPMEYTRLPPAARFAEAAMMTPDELSELENEYEHNGLTWLGRKRSDCERFLRDAGGPPRRGPEPDYVLRYCTILSAKLIIRFSNRAITTSGPEGPLHIIASLLVEGLTGRSEVGGLRPHCDWVRVTLPHLIEGWRE